MNRIVIRNDGETGVSVMHMRRGTLVEFITIRPGQTGELTLGVSDELMVHRYDFLPDAPRKIRPSVRVEVQETVQQDMSAMFAVYVPGLPLRASGPTLEIAYRTLAENLAVLLMDNHPFEYGLPNDTAKALLAVR
jgi:hypothetical protein